MQGYDSMEERRRRLLEAMQGQRGGQVLGNVARSRPIFGAGKRRGAGDLAPMARPGLTFNPFHAQLAGGAQGLHGPSRIDSPVQGPQQMGAGQQMAAYDPFAGRGGGTQFFDVPNNPPGFYGGAQGGQPLLGALRKASPSASVDPRFKPPLDPTRTF